MPLRDTEIKTGRYCKLRPCVDCGALVGRGAKRCKPCSAQTVIFVRETTRQRMNAMRRELGMSTADLINAALDALPATAMRTYLVALEARVAKLEGSYGLERIYAEDCETRCGRAWH